MFEVVNDTEIWFNGVRVARFDPSVWPTLRDEVEKAFLFAGYDDGYTAAIEECESRKELER